MIYPLSKFHAYNGLLLTIFILLYIRSIVFIMHNWNFVFFDQYLSISLSPKSLATTILLCFYEFGYFRMSV